MSVNVKGLSIEKIENAYNCIDMTHENLFKQACIINEVWEKPKWNDFSKSSYAHLREWGQRGCGTNVSAVYCYCYIYTGCDVRRIWLDRGPGLRNTLIGAVTKRNCTQNPTAILDAVDKGKHQDQDAQYYQGKVGEIKRKTQRKGKKFQTKGSDL